MVAHKRYSGGGVRTTHRRWWRRSSGGGGCVATVSQRGRSHGSEDRRRDSGHSGAFTFKTAKSFPLTSQDVQG
eukprot:471943-Prymnesium_polylepis.1